MTTDTAQNELMKSAQFHPVFGPNGEIQGISQLTVATDRRLGMRAMEDLAEEYKPGDEAIVAGGWTAKQARILRSAAPTAAHYLKPSKKYDATSGEMIPSMTIIMPYEVTWRLFEILFEGQYSIDINKISTETEDVLSVSFQEGGNEEKKKGDDAPGRIFYTRAEVTITLHLSGSQERRYTGVGVAYDHVRQSKAGNVYAINSARRTADKGAISDAKREAVSTIGRVFRRAFEDGDQMIQVFEEMLLTKLREFNKVENPARARAAEKVAAPAGRKSAPEATPATAAQQSEAKQEPAPEAKKEPAKKVTPKKRAKTTPAKKAKKANPAPEVSKPEKDIEQDEVPFDKFEGQAENVLTYSIARQGQVIDQSDDPDLFFDRIADVLAEVESQDEARRIFNENMDDLTRAESQSGSGNTVAALKELVFEAMDVENGTDKEEEKLPEAEITPENAESANDWEIQISKPTGVAILAAYEGKFGKAKTVKDIDKILDTNTEMAKRLTKTQKGKLLQATMVAKKSVA